MGAQMVKEVATKTSDVAGDGTTTAIILAQAIIHEGLKNVTAGANPMFLKRGIQKAVDAVVADLKKRSKEIKSDHAQIANVEVTDPEAFQEYAKGAPATVDAYGGKYIVRGGAIEVLEGDWAPKRLTIIQFDSTAQAKAWFALKSRTGNRSDDKVRKMASCRNRPGILRRDVFEKYRIPYFAGDLL